MGASHTRSWVPSRQVAAQLFVGDRLAGDVAVEDRLRGAAGELDDDVVDR
jgi:hypothetical protein